MAATEKQCVAPLAEGCGDLPRAGGHEQYRAPRHPASSLTAGMATLERLGAFYEQHTFDTQGPYADLFAVLLSSCKHVIDISTELVWHAEAQEAQNARLRATNDVLCGEVAQQRAELREVRAAMAPAEARRGSANAVGDSARSGEVLVQSPREASSAAPRSVDGREGGSGSSGIDSSSARAAVYAAEEGAPLHHTPAPVRDSTALEHLAAAGSVASTSASEGDLLSTPRREPPPPAKDLRASLSPSGTPHPLPAAAVNASNTAWRAEVEARMADMQERFTKALIDSAAAAARQQHEADVARSLQDQASQRAVAASLEAWKDELHDSTDRRLQQLAQHVASVEKREMAEQQELRQSLLSSMKTWKQQVEQDTSDRLDDLTARLAEVELRVHAQQRRLHWLDDDTAAQCDDATAGPTTSPEVPHAAARANADCSPRGGPDAPSPVSWSVAPPPTALQRWLGEQQHAAHAEWVRVLREVQENLLCPSATAAAPAPAPSPTPPASAAAATHPPACSADGMPHGNGAAPQAEQQQHQHQHQQRRLRQELVSAISSLLRHHNAQVYERAVADAVERAQRTDDALHDVRSRVEVLEVYAPHHHAVASRPPLLGVELEDVVEPRLGVRLRRVYRGYLGDKAGLSVGDVIVGVGRQSVHTRAQLFALMGELTRDYNAECRVLVEQGYVRQFVLGDEGCYTQHGHARRVEDGGLDGEMEVNCGYGASRGEDAWAENASTSFLLDQALLRARAEAAAVGGGSGGRSSSKAAVTMRWAAGQPVSVPQPAARPMFASSSPSTAAHASAHRAELAQCLPYFELCLHVIRDGGLRDVTLLVPPADALRSETTYGA